MLSCVQPFGDPMDCSPPGSAVHGIFLARILEWVAISTSRGEYSIDIANLMPVWTFILKICYYFSCILSTCKTSSQNNREGLWPKKKGKKPQNNKKEQRYKQEDMDDRFLCWALWASLPDFLQGLLLFVPKALGAGAVLRLLGKQHAWAAGNILTCL